MMWIMRNIFRRFRRQPPQQGLANLYRGSFELRVDRIVGWAQNTYGSRDRAIEIDVYAASGLIATYTATAIKNDDRFEFNFPVEGRFTASQLLREEVYLAARDREGNRGPIRLDGAAHIELIRQDTQDP